MIKSDQIELLTKSLISFQREMKSVFVDADNPYFKSKYATLTNIVECSKEQLAKNGLAITQLATGDGGITTILMHESGQYIGDTMTLKPVKDDPQGRGSAITYTRRYAYASILGIVSDLDDDGNEASGQNKAPIKQPLAKGADDLRTLVADKSKECFRTTDEYKTWRIANKHPEDLTKATDMQLASLLLALKAMNGTHVR